MNGQNRHRAKTGSMPHAFALTLFEDLVYWTDTIKRAPKYTGANRVVMGNNTHHPNDIHIYHPYRQPRSDNPCNDHHLTCSHLCLIGPGGTMARYECPDHFIGLAVGFKIQCVADCSSTQFRCGDNEKCIPIWWKCDVGPDHKCDADTEFSCKTNYRCIPLRAVCDGANDCLDSSDEQSCHKSHVMI
ncbi:hypothetical protein cypCar_00040724 [Cyprinus carpio]|nr:hypothetical protein cypCar_00040724 [Cyprinus carpio]